MRKILVALILSAALVVTLSTSVLAQSYPTKPIRLIVPFSAGGGVDTFARIIGSQLTKSWGQPVIVDNHSGASGLVGMDLTAKAPPDGYTIALMTGVHAVNPSIYRKLPYDTVKDFKAVARIAYTSNVLIINPSLRANSMKELIALVKSNPGKFNYACSYIGDVNHLGMEMLKKALGLDIVMVPYKGGGSTFKDLLGGQVQMTFGNIMTSMPLVKAGKLRALAVSSPNRIPSFPDLPSIAEAANLPGFGFRLWYGFFAPAGTPKEIVFKLNTEIVKIMQLPDIKGRIESMGGEIAVDTPEEFTSFVESEIKEWAKVVKEAGISPRD